MSIARHATIAAVTGTIVIAIAVVLLTNGVAGAGGTGSADGRPVGTQLGTTAPRQPDAAASKPTTGRQAPAAAPTSAPKGTAPKIRPDDARLGPHEAQASCLSAGNAGMADGSWDDYECVGGSGNWRVRPQQR